MITCKGKLILVGRRDERGRYRIRLVQQQGQWKLNIPTKASKKYLQQANSVYILPSIEEVVKWIHATCSYPGKSMWLKAIKSGNFTGWSIINERTVAKYYPETTETPKGHLNQTRKHVRSTKHKSAEKGTRTTTIAAYVVHHGKAKK